MTLIIFLMLLGDTFPIDEIHAQALGNAASQGPIILFTGISGFNITLYWYDLEKEETKTLDQQKIRIPFPKVHATSDGFILSQTFGKANLVHLDEHGEYASRQYLSEFEGWREDIVLKTIVTAGDRIIAHFENQERKVVSIAHIDTKEQRFSFIFERRQPDDTDIRFYSWQNGYLEINEHTGHIQLLSSKFDRPRTLLPGYELQPMDPKRPLARRMKYGAILWPMAISKDRISFVFNKPDPYATEKYPDPLRLALHLIGDQLTEGKTIILGEHKGQQLHYDLVEKEFSIIRDQKKED